MKEFIETDLIKFFIQSDLAALFKDQKENNYFLKLNSPAYDPSTEWTDYHFFTNLKVNEKIDGLIFKISLIPKKKIFI